MELFIFILCILWIGAQRLVGFGMEACEKALNGNREQKY